MAKREKPIEIITPPNMLRVKVGGRIAAADPAAIKRAEAAIDQMKVEFQDWLAEEVAKLEKAYARAVKEGIVGEAGEQLFVVAHDLRGLGATYEFPIITRMAASLARLIEDDEKRASIPVQLAGAHVAAICAAVRQNIRTDDNPVGRQLAEELEAQVTDLVGLPN